MKRNFYLLVVAALVMTSTACSKDPSTTNAGSLGKPDSLASAPAAAPAPDNVTSAPAAPPAPRVKTTIPAGTKLRVALLDTVSSDKSRPGDQFIATLAEPVVVGGKTVFAKGTRVRGRVVDAKQSGRVKGRASIELTLTEVMPATGGAVSIFTKPFSQVAEATKKRDAAIIGGGAGLGAVIGAIAGGGKGAAVGAAVGGGAGTGTVLATKGKEIHLGPETRVPFTLARSIEI